ncbi:MAG: hypothetical protein P4L31_00740 [Candidatus Babeliales bacterium]|nr:hypothetical protein [Candidatus Babeliales bacterium]
MNNIKRNRIVMAIVLVLGCMGTSFISGFNPFSGSDWRSAVSSLADDMKIVGISLYKVYHLDAVTSFVADLYSDTSKLLVKIGQDFTKLDTANGWLTLSTDLYRLTPLKYILDPLMCNVKVQNLVGDQNWDINEQLKSGLRVFKLPIHPVHNVTWVAHTLQNREIDGIFDGLHAKMDDQLPGAVKTSLYPILNPILGLAKDEMKRDLWRVDSTNVQFLEVLTQLKKFLDNNPHEVVTLMLNIFDFSSIKASFLKDFVTSGIDKYIHIQNINNEWPTFGQMIKDNKRLVVFTDESAADRIAENTGFHHVNEFVYAGNYEFDSVAKLTADTCQHAMSDSAFHNKNALFTLNHFVTKGLAGNADEAQSANQYSNLKEHIDKCKATIARYPNFITIDFVDLNRADLQKVVDEINSKDW